MNKEGQWIHVLIMTLLVGVFLAGEFLGEERVRNSVVAGGDNSLAELFRVARDDWDVSVFHRIGTRGKCRVSAEKKTVDLIGISRDSDSCEEAAAKVVARMKKLGVE